MLGTHAWRKLSPVVLLLVLVFAGLTSALAKTNIAHAAPSAPAHTRTTETCDGGTLCWGSVWWNNNVGGATTDPYGIEIDCLLCTDSQHNVYGYLLNVLSIQDAKVPTYFIMLGEDRAFNGNNYTAYFWADTRPEDMGRINYHELGAYPTDDNYKSGFAAIWQANDDKYQIEFNDYDGDVYAGSSTYSTGNSGWSNGGIWMGQSLWSTGNGIVIDSDTCDFSGNQWYPSLPNNAQSKYQTNGGSVTSYQEPTGSWYTVPRSGNAGGLFQSVTN